MKKIKLSPSILSADFCCLKDEIKSVEKADYLHLDVMDGHFVNNISFGIPVIKSLKKISKLIFDVHLMIENPEKYIEVFLNSGADIITVHYEAGKNIKRDLDLIKKFNKKACVAIKPETEAKKIFDLLDKIDMVLVMTVEPGFGGQKIIYETLDKISEINKFALENDIDIDIEADGGINFDNVKLVLNSGANVIVIGSALFNLDLKKKKKKIIEFYEASKNFF